MEDGGEQAAEMDLERACARRAIGTRMSVEGGLGLRPLTPDREL